MDVDCVFFYACILQLSDDEVHKKLHAFRMRHYTAQSMTLVVQAQESLETLEEMVVDSFSDVANNQQDKETFHNQAKPFESLKFHKIYKVRVPSLP